MRNTSRILLSLLSVLFFLTDVSAQTPVGTSFTYQGRLTDGGNAATGVYDFSFRLFDGAVGGNQVGSTITRDNGTVTAGVFSVSLDFGSVFGGSARWLEIGVRPGASTGSYTTLAPLQQLTPTPNALYSTNAANAVTVGGLTCANGQVAKWSGAVWTCGTDLDTNSGGTVTNVAAGAGLTGGPITGSGTISLATTQLLPTIACTTNQIVKWNGSAWACATVSFAGTDVTVQIFGDAGAVASNSCTNSLLDVPGAEVGDVLLGTFVGSTPPPPGLVFQLLKVSSPDQATMRYCNPTNAPSPAFSNVGFRVITFR